MIPGGHGSGGVALVTKADFATGVDPLGGRIVLAANLAASSTSSSFAGQDLGAGTSLSTGSATARTLSARGADAFNPKDYGAVAASTAIGTGFGSTLAALASYTVGGSTPYAWVTNPAWGLTFTLATSAAQSAAGTGLTFVTKLSGINGWSAASASWATPANGADIMQAGLLVSGAGIPTGTTVASFNAATGVVTLSGNTAAAVASGTAITFTLAPSQMQALTLDYLGLQSAVVAASNAGGGTVKVPAGHYHPVHPVFTPGITNANQFSGGVDIEGAGKFATRLDFTTDYGPGVCALGEANRGPGSMGYSRLSNLNLYGPGTGNQQGRTVAGMDGFCMGSKDRMDHTSAALFHAGLSILEDHGLVAQSDFSNNYYGIWFAPNGDTIGNWDISDTPSVGEAVAGIAVAWNNSIAAGHIKNLDVGGNSPYSFYREALPSGQTNLPMGFISSTVIDNAWGESVGNGYIYGENAGDSVSQNTFVGGQPAIGLVSNSAVQFTGRGIKAVIYVGSLTSNSFIGTDLSNSGGNMGLVTDALIESRNAIQGNDFGNMGSLLDNGTVYAKPIISSMTNNGFNAFNRFRSGRNTGEFRVTEGPATVGQVMTAGTQYSLVGSAPMAAATQTPIGVALQSGSAYSMVPIVTDGFVSVTKVAGTAIATGSNACVSSATPSSVTACAPGMGVVGYDVDGGGASSAATNAYLSVHPVVQPQIATASVAGLVKPGSNLTVAADGTLNASAGGTGSAALLGSVSYNPASSVAYASPGLAPTTAVIDAARLGLTFTAPSSGSVLVRFTGYQTTSAVPFFLAVRDTGTGADVTGTVSRVTAEASSRHDLYEVKLTGLKAGQSYNWTPSYACSSSTANACYLSAGGTGAGAYGSTVFEVWAD